MKVTLAKFGGLAAGIRRPLKAVESASLPESSAAELAQLVASAKAGSIEREPKPGSVRDAMSYTITVDGAGQPVVMTQSDGSMSPEFASLLDWLEQHAATDEK
ncbi:MAG: protealysin inhibitor emfourin [Bryobacteraceae bacterium]